MLIGETKYDIKKETLSAISCYIRDTLSWNDHGVGNRR